MAIVDSYCSIQGELVRVNIEVMLTPGLPQFSFLGVTDRGFRSLGERIRSALKSSGFQVPRGKRVLVDFRPRILTSAQDGLDLAIAAGYLLESWQIDPEFQKKAFVGNLSLKGEVLPSASMSPEHFEYLVSSGLIQNPKNLNDLKTGLSFAELNKDEPQNPSSMFGQIFSNAKAPVLIRTKNREQAFSLIYEIHRAVSTLNQEEHEQIRQFSMPTEIDNHRPLVFENLALELSALDLLGGGVRPRPGAITRASHGTLVLENCQLLKLTERVELFSIFKAKRRIAIARGKIKKWPIARNLILLHPQCDCWNLVRISSDLDCICTPKTRLKYETSFKQLSQLPMAAVFDFVKHPEIADELSKWCSFRLSNQFTTELLANPLEQMNLEIRLEEFLRRFDIDRLIDPLQARYILRGVVPENQGDLPSLAQTTSKEAPLHEPELSINC